MNEDMERSNGMRQEMEGPDEAPYSTARSGAGGEPAREDDRMRAASGGTLPSGESADETIARLRGDADDDGPTDNDQSVVGHAGSGGSPPGFVAPPPGADWPDPMGGDDDERELERRTR